MEMKGTEKKERRLRGGGEQTSTDFVERRIRLGIMTVYYIVAFLVCCAPKNQIKVL